VKILKLIELTKNTYSEKSLIELVNPNEFEKEILKDTKIYFRITKQVKNEYFFVLDDDMDKYTVYSGKFVKTE
jgi:hypothetical protein